MSLVVETETKSQLIDAAGAVQAALEHLAETWDGLIAAYRAARGEARASASDRTLTDFDNCIDYPKIRELVVSCARANRLRYVFEGTGHVEGTDNGKFPDAVNIAAKVSRMLEGV